MKIKNREKAIRIWKRIQNSNVPIAWHCMDEPRLVQLVTEELMKIEKEEENE